MSQNQTHTTSYLIIDKADFKKELENQITKGNLLYSREIPPILEVEYFIYNLSGRKFKEYDLFVKDYSRWDAYNTELLENSFNNPDSKYMRSYTNAEFFPIQGINDNYTENKKKTLKLKIGILESLLETSHFLKIAPLQTESSTPTSIALPQNNKVFIVHGHDSGIKNEVARFIEQVGLEPIILHEQASGGKTIIEKIETNADVGFGIVLYTPCDVGAAEKDKADDKYPFQSRARQNVVFEHGYLIGRLGRDRVCALTNSSVETPGDMSGVVYVPIGADGAWRYKIATEMNAVGYNIDKNKIK